MFELSLRTLALEAWKYFANNGYVNRQFVNERTEKPQANAVTRSTTMGKITHQSTSTPLSNMIQIWNMLPQQIRNEKSINLVRPKIERYAAEQVHKMV